MATTWTAPVEVALTTELYGVLSEHERAMLPLLLDACAEMDEIFWQEAYGDRDALLSTIDDPDVRRFAEFNYGPWDRQAGNAPFLSDGAPKPVGARFYPADMTTAEFETACAESPERAVALLPATRTTPAAARPPVPLQRSAPLPPSQSPAPSRLASANPRRPPTSAPPRPPAIAAARPARAPPAPAPLARAAPARR